MAHEMHEHPRWKAEGKTVFKRTRGNKGFWIEHIVFSSELEAENFVMERVLEEKKEK